MKTRLQFSNRHLLSSTASKVAVTGCLLTGYLLTGCDTVSDLDAGPPVIEDPDAGNNLSVAWSDAPSETIALDQGRWVTLPLTLVGDTDEVTVEVREGDLEVVVEAESLQIRAGYLISGPASVTLSITPTGGVESLVTVSAEVTPLRWQRGVTWSLNDGPEEREHATAIYDAANEQIFFFGGSGYFPYLSAMTDFWRYDVNSATWEEIVPTGTPPENGASRRFAGDWGSGEGLIFGAYLPGTDFSTDDALYRVRVTGETLDFELLSPANTPSARSLHGFAKDPAADRYVLFGGFGDAGISNDTWLLTFDGEEPVWIEISNLTSPSARYGFFAGLDPATRRWFVFGGGQQPVSQADSVNAADDTWFFDFSTEPPSWTRLEIAPLPPGRRNGCTVLDLSGPRLLVLGGTADAATTEPGVFALDLTLDYEAWEAVNPDPEVDTAPLRSSGTGISDGERSFCGFGNGTNAAYRDWTVLSYDD